MLRIQNTVLTLFCCFQFVASFPQKNNNNAGSKKIDSIIKGITFNPVLFKDWTVNRIDSLATVILKTQGDTNKLYQLNAISYLYDRRFEDGQKVLKYANEALLLCDKLGTSTNNLIIASVKKNKVLATFNLGNGYTDNGNWNEGLNHYLKGIKAAEEIGYTQVLGYYYSEVGNFYSVYRDEKDYKQAEKYYLLSIKKCKEFPVQVHPYLNAFSIAKAYFELAASLEPQARYEEELSTYQYIITAAKNKNSLGTVYYNIGRLYNHIGNYSLALENYFKALKLNDEMNDKITSAACLIEIGDVYTSLENYPEALKYEFEAVKIAKDIGVYKNLLRTATAFIGNIYYAEKKFEESLKFHLEALELAKQLKMQLTPHYVDIGASYLKLNKFDDAIKYEVQALELAKKNDDQYNVGVALATLGEIHLQLKHFSEARSYSMKALNILEPLAMKPEIMPVYSILAEIDSAEGKYQSAYENYKRYILYRDSVDNKQNTQKVTRLQLQYEYGKKEDSLKYQERLTEEKLKQQTLLTSQRSQAFMLKAKELSLISKEKELQRLAYLKTQADLQAEQSKRHENEKQLIISEQEKTLQKTKLDLQASELGLQNKEISAKKTERNIFIAGTIALLLAVFFIFRNFQNQRRINELIKASSEKEKIELQLQSLRAQLNPHFMFNSLNAIQELIVTEQNERSQSYLERFAKLVRMLLENADQPLIPLRKELSFIELYLSLESLRLPDLKYFIEIDPEVQPEKLMTPNMMLQPYIENALWHGLQHQPGEKKLQLHIYKQNGSLEYVIKDNGVGRKKAAEIKSLYRREHKSKGMELLSKRFSLLSKEYGKQIETTITDLGENGKIEGTLVKLLFRTL